MKTIWKILGATVLAAAVPLRMQKDEHTGQTKYQSLLLSVDVTPNKDLGTKNIDINIGEGVLSRAVMSAITAKEEAKLFTNDPDEAVVTETLENFEADLDETAPETVEPDEKDFLPD